MFGGWMNKYVPRVKPLQDDHSRVWTTGSLRVCLEVRLITEFPSLSLPPLSLGPYSKHRKSNGIFQRAWAFWTIYMTKYLRTVTSDQHWGISLPDLSQRMRAHMLGDPHLPSGESLQKCHLMHYQTISQGLQGGFQGQEPTRGMQIPVPSLRAHTGFVAHQTCFLTALMYQCIA